MVLLDFNESLNIVTDSQYAEGVAFHIKSAELLLDNSELGLLFMQPQKNNSEKNLSTIYHSEFH